MPAQSGCIGGCEKGGKMVRLSLERLSRMEAEFEQANVRMGEAVWNTYSGEGAADLDGAQREISRILTNSPDRALVDGWQIGRASCRERGESAGGAGGG